MFNDINDIDPEKMHELYALFAERTRWATLSITIDEIAKDNKELVRDLSRYDPAIAVPLLSSLLTLPKYQSNCIRIEILIALAVTHCRGHKKANTAQIINWFSLIDKSQCVIGEDPAEDVFVSLVQDKFGDYRLLEGTWEAAGFYTQRFLDIIETMPDTEQFRQTKKSVRALLIVSDIVCQKAGLHRYQLGSDERHSVLSASSLPGRTALISRVKISFNELEERSITLNDLEPFIFQPAYREGLPAQAIGLSSLDRCPLIIYDETHLNVVLPTALSVALRDYVITHIIENGLVESFNKILSQCYSKLFYETPLLGGPFNAVALWKTTGTYRLSTFYLEVDQGYYITFHLFLPSITAHLNGGFKTAHYEEGSFVEALQSSIDDTAKKIEGLEGFKKGLIALVGCGWGKGFALPHTVGLDRPNWYCENISAADLVRLSWLSDMSPGYFWRIQDGLQAITDAGVEIINPNGILNLIGWVRSNDGHFVPHSQLPDGVISKERPLAINPPLNMIRDIRAEADHAYERHRAIDNNMVRHDVQRALPNPFFSSDSSKRVYASMDDVKNDVLTAVYEGVNNLWITVSSPKMSERQASFKLWEMAHEWLHRIGHCLDQHKLVTIEALNLRVYVEFHDDDSVLEGKEPPTEEDLIQLCTIVPQSEPSAYKAIFLPGFMRGFRIADNVAERLFVRTLAQAYLELFGIMDSAAEAQAIEALVVKNHEARSFHLFHAQQFIDYVKDTLPKDLITIDPIDDAAIKIGLGLRVLKNGQDTNIEGKDECTKFLSQVVDVLLSDIIEALKGFDRLSTLKRLVSNNEKASTEGDHWKRTSAAILGLHGKEPKTIDRYVEKKSEFTGAGISSRILTEIALCVCPTDDGSLLSDIELSKLIACASLVVRLGGLSDTIYYQALKPELKVSPLGDILFRNDFGELVVEPMLARVIGDQFVEEAPFQRKNYVDPGISPKARGTISDEFEAIWGNEMGFSLDEARYIIEALENKGVEDHNATFMLKQSEYFPLVCSDEVSKDTAQKFLGQFSLYTRQHWDKPPKGFRMKDIYPWRFGRRLSYVSRSILKVDKSEDPLLIISPDALRKSFIYVVDGAYSGRLEQDFFRTEQMRNGWLGKAGEGHTFNAEVAKTLSEAGWQVRENIGLPEIFNGKFEQDYGDVDVLAWRPDYKEVLVIECKDLSLARNYSEIAALLSDYQGTEHKGKPDKLKRHLNRFELLKDKLDLLQKFTGVQDIKLVSCLVCSGVVPMQYAKIEALSNTFIGDISDILLAHN